MANCIPAGFEDDDDSFDDYTFGDDEDDDIGVPFVRTTSQAQSFSKVYGMSRSETMELP